jgi:hypothetical protein
VTRQLASNGTSTEKEYILRIQTQGESVFEEFLVDTWVSQERVAFIDLQAGPFHWGPSSVGEGVRTLESIPEPPHASETSIFVSQREIHDTTRKSGQYSDEIKYLAERWHAECNDFTSRNKGNCLSMCLVQSDDSSGLLSTATVVRAY